MGAMGAGESPSVDQHGLFRVSRAISSPCLSQQALYGSPLLDSVQKVLRIVTSSGQRRV